jgi:hypothetical protein
VATKDPSNASNNVMKTTKVSGPETWAGTTVGTFSTSIPVTASASNMSLKVYSPSAGIHIRLKLEDHTNNTHTVETEAITSVF